MSCFGCSSRYASAKKFAVEGLELHNKARLKHNAKPLRLTKELVQHAQQWAEYLVKTHQDTPVMEHLKRKNIGQNVAIKESYDNCVDYTAWDIVSEWYRGIDIYEPYFGKEPPTPDIIKGYSHFSQMVWKDSREMGMGKAIGYERTVIVASYKPAGNIPGMFAKNVTEEDDKILLSKFFKM